MDMISLRKPVGFIADVLEELERGASRRKTKDFK